MGWSAHAGSNDEKPVAANPTLVNNVETLAAASHILAKGPEWYRSFGTWDSPGTMVFTVVGDVIRPDYQELPLGLPLAEIIDRVGGGVRPGRKIKAVFSGVSNGVMTADQLDTPATYADLRSIGSGLGAAGFIVYDDTADMVAVAHMFSRFLYVESCGQCSACKLNSGEITTRLQRLETGLATIRDIGEIGGLLRMVTDQNRCFLPEEEQTIVSSIMRAFPDEFVEHLEGLRVPGRSYPLPKIADLDNGRVAYDKRINRKQPDWTYRSRRPLAG
jgi:NADH-quinone oxidoreductase subunit F